MIDDKNIFEIETDSEVPDPEEVPIRERKVVTQPYDFNVDSLIIQIKNSTIFLKPLSERPDFQRKYVWNDKLASRLIESILLNIPIPPCYLSQNEDYELDVIDGQQRLYSLFRFIENQFKLTSLEVIKELNGLRFHEIDHKLQRQIKTHTIRCVLITNESHPEVKFDVFERLNTNTAPLNAQELRNCIYRGSLNSLIKELSTDTNWLRILGKKAPDPRMRDEELILRFFAFKIKGIENYKTPQKHWLNEVAKDGRKLSTEEVNQFKEKWDRAIQNSLIWFNEKTCFRRPGAKVINRALFDLIMDFAERNSTALAQSSKNDFLEKYRQIIANEEFQDLISRAVDHTSRTRRRFKLWNDAMDQIGQ
ncbi:DUF262 domain-containing protein [Chromobacterium sp. IRSSSOUMB001]|uniref:DUF262 domain-containing protein n=1 Tax=Chromobacterium sp. IRSSSOUMB001 TaxID=2927123 RepID=UPI0020BD81D1|nr:DUF262 domain-containing protein [Chromobacterium sp. IRSSSOUMB001]